LPTADLSPSRKLDISYANDYAYDLIKYYAVARTLTGSGLYASYKAHGESIWKIGFDSTEIRSKVISARTKATYEEVNEQLKLDLKKLSYKIANLIFWPLNAKKKAAVLSYAFSIGFPKFKTSELLNIINKGNKRKEIIKFWSPFINTNWRHKGDQFVSQRRSELDLYLSADKEVPTLIKHNCKLKYCLLNIADTYNGSINQIKAITYLEKKLLEFDPSGEVLRRFFRYWNQVPGGLGSPHNL
jgi:GH24 family phage-related lysozyme (muramidase)